MLTTLFPALESQKTPLEVFGDLIAPFSWDIFCQKYRDQTPLHIPGTLEKFPKLMPLERLNRLLSMASFWTSQTLQLVVEGQMMDPRLYCALMASQNGPVQRPVCEKVMDFMRQGAALVCNDIDSLTPELRALHRLLGQVFQAKIQANVYVSWAQKQAFKSHFDTHDVWAFQTVGEKVWRLYQGRADHPIAHPFFKNFGQAHHDKAKGELAFDVTLRPGDMLYIPRGVYHDALASSATSIHVTFGITRPIGLDLLSLLFEKALGASFFRQNIPTTDPLCYLQQFEKECAHLMASDDFKEALSLFNARFPSFFPEYTLPNLHK